MNALLLIALAACTPAEVDPGIPDDTAQDDTGSPPLEYAFSFAAVADAHLYGNAEAEARLVAAADWLDGQAGVHDLRVVLALGDMAWSGGREAIDALVATRTAPWVPVIGDNEIATGEESLFADTWAATLARAAAELEGWETSGLSSTFLVDGVRFALLDWCSRSDSPVYSEMAELHDEPGGTLPWLEGVLGAWEGPPGSVFFGAHHPMFMSPGSFDQEEAAILATLPGAAEGVVAANFAGHYHGDYDETPTAQGWNLHILDALWDDEVTVALVHVSSDGTRFAYELERVIVE